MKFKPTACWRMRISPGPGAATSTSSYTRASGPPTLCTRTALVITISPLGTSAASKRKPSKPHCQLGGLNWLVHCISSVALGKHVEQFDRRRERDGKIDVAARNMEFEAIRHQRDADQHQECQRQHLGGGMIGHEPRHRT